METKPGKILSDIQKVVVVGDRTGKWMKQAYLSYYFNNETISLSYIRLLDDKTLQLFFEMLTLRRNYDWFEDRLYAFAQYLRSVGEDGLSEPTLANLVTDVDATPEISAPKWRSKARKNISRFIGF